MRYIPNLNPHIEHEYFNDKCPKKVALRFAQLFQTVWSRISLNILQMVLEHLQLRRMKMGDTYGRSSTLIHPGWRVSKASYAANASINGSR
jgi:hypothetical protein